MVWLAVMGCLNGGLVSAKVKWGFGEGGGGAAGKNGGGGKDEKVVSARIEKNG
jgi:hypothetical protein